MSIFRRINQHGDTIVEVLIAVVIVSGVLGATFAVSSKSLKSTQANHERFQAQMYANQQAEWIKVYAAENRQSLFTNGASTFCMTSESNFITSTDAQCTKDQLYKITITPKQMPEEIGGATNKFNTYYIHVEWLSLTARSADGLEKLDLVYGI